MAALVSQYRTRLVTRAALHCLGARAVCTKTNHDRNDKRRPPTTNHYGIDGRSDDPGILGCIPRPAAPLWSEGSADEAKWCLFDGAGQAQELLPAVHGKASQADAYKAEGAHS